MYLSYKPCGIYHNTAFQSRPGERPRTAERTGLSPTMPAAQRPARPASSPLGTFPLPGGTLPQYCNYSDEPAELVFAVAPRYTWARAVGGRAAYRQELIRPWVKEQRTRSKGCWRP